MKRNLLAAAACAGLLVQGCSSRPREFTPMLAVASATPAAFESARAECNNLLIAGKLDQNGRVASAGVGVATGAATMAVGAGAASAAGLAGGMAIASATVVLIPFAIVGGAIGMAKRKRAKKEKAIQTAMAGCLKERGYEVTAWGRPS